MNLRRLAFAASMASAVAAVGFVPFIGFTASLFVSLFVWAAAGFRWWLFTLPLVALVDTANFVQTTSVAAAMGQAAAVALPHAPSAVYQNFVMMETGIMVAYPLILWFTQRELRKDLVKRVGRSRLP